MKCRYKKLVVGFQKKKGRSAQSGRRIIFSKGSNLFRNVYRSATSGFCGLFAMSLIVEYQKIPQRNNILALLCNTLGC
jgi:hypothetical protein